MAAAAAATAAVTNDDRRITRNNDAQLTLDRLITQSSWLQRLTSL